MAKRAKPFRKPPLIDATLLPESIMMLCRGSDVRSPASKEGEFNRSG
jgi:hypothetical protein